jgi:2-oxoglutarate dehydrogenase E2 component (dihydrolipoamide succinyltransferase)
MDIVMPQLGETVKEGTLTVWRKKVGEAIKADEVLFEVSTDKVETEVPAPASGVLAEILIGEGETVPVGTRLAIIADAGGRVVASVPAARPVTAPASRAPTERSTSAGVASPARRDTRGRPLSPVVRRLLAEHELDAAGISGTGEGGRIKRKDVLAHLKKQPGPFAPAARAPAHDASTVRIPLSRIRRQIGEHMVRSKATSPHVLQAIEADFDRVEKARTAHGEAWKAKEGFSLTYLPFVAGAACRAIEDFPHVNASIEGEALVVHQRVNLGIAVDLSFEGLIVPVVKDAHRMSVADLARAIRGLADRARDKRLSPDDLSGGTYTISNSGPYGTMITAPVISQPQVAILSTDGVRKRPVVIETPAGDAIAIRPTGVLAQCFDHRAFDGAYSASFLKRLKEIIETRDWSRDFA